MSVVLELGEYMLDNGGGGFDVHVYVSVFPVIDVLFAVIVS